MKSAVCFLSFFALVAVYGASAARLSDRCLSRHSCTSDPQTVWATDGVSCFPLRNKCHFEEENCDRIARRVKTLNLTSQKRCQKLCGVRCPKDFVPVCADFCGTAKFFINDCVRINYSCHSGLTYIPCGNFYCDAREILDQRQINDLIFDSEQNK